MTPDQRKAARENLKAHRLIWTCSGEDGRWEVWADAEDEMTAALDALDAAEARIGLLEGAIEHLSGVAFVHRENARCECSSCDITRLVNATDTRTPLIAAEAERVAGLEKALEHERQKNDEWLTWAKDRALAAPQDIEGQVGE